MLILPDYPSPSGAATRRVKESLVQRSFLRWAVHVRPFCGTKDP
jgi:hypothetical protein